MPAGGMFFWGLQGMALIIDSIESDKPFEWRGPKAVLLLESERQLRGWKGKLFRTLIITAGVELFFYFLLKPLPLKEIGFDLNKSFAIIFLWSLGMSVFSYLIAPYFSRFDEIKYKIDNKGVRINSFSRSRLYRWKDITQCKPIERYEGLEGVICIYVHTKKSYGPKPLLFDVAESEFAEKVHDYIQSKLPQQMQNQPEDLPGIKLAFRQHVYMTGFSLIGALVGVYSMYRLQEYGKKDWALLLLPIIVFLGPGTWGVVALFGRKSLKYKDSLAWGFIYNFVTLMLTLIIGVIFAIVEVSKAFR
jgi:hypothetical protein